MVLKRFQSHETVLKEVQRQHLILNLLGRLELESVVPHRSHSELSVEKGGHELELFVSCNSEGVRVGSSAFRGKLGDHFVFEVLVDEFESLVFPGCVLTSGFHLLVQDSVSEDVVQNIDIFELFLQLIVQKSLFGNQLLMELYFLGQIFLHFEDVAFDSVALISDLLELLEIVVEPGGKIEVLLGLLKIELLVVEILVFIGVYLLDEQICLHFEMLVIFFEFDDSVQGKARVLVLHLVFPLAQLFLKEREKVQVILETDSVLCPREVLVHFFL